MIKVGASFITMCYNDHGANTMTTTVLTGIDGPTRIDLLATGVASWLGWLECCASITKETSLNPGKA